MLDLGFIFKFFLHVFLSSVLYGAIRQTELYLTSSVRIGQNGKTQLQLVTIGKVGNLQGFRLLRNIVHHTQFGSSNKGVVIFAIY